MFSPPADQVLRQRQQAGSLSPAFAQIVLARLTDPRGLLLVSQFTQRWGVRYEDHGKTISVEEPFTSVV
ncbi:hypothetical protein [Streptomyces umbrinus]|uniref:hypothetical protein n=1 Tax=Streptomyces umbrinus TaxID=67370 RepID=UPI003446C4E9